MQPASASPSREAASGNSYGRQAQKRIAQTMIRRATSLTTLILSVVCVPASNGQPQAASRANTNRSAEDRSLHFFIAPDGNDRWSGRLPTPNASKTDGPFATLERARDAIRQWKSDGKHPDRPILVELRGGTYERARPFELAKRDSGTATGWITYRPYENEHVLISGGRRVARWQRVTDNTVLAKMAPKARGHVYRANLRELGITDFGSVERGGIELYFNGKPMTLARWPNEGFVHIGELVGGKPFTVHGQRGDRIGRFRYEGDRPRRWQHESSVWLHGFWFWDWSDERQEVESIDVEKRIISLKPPYHRYGYRKGQWYYAFNLLCELDRPGEWYLDRLTGMLYFWPPSPIDSSTAVVSVASTLLKLQDVSYVVFEDLGFEHARRTAISIQGGRDCLIRRCTLRNIGESGISVASGRHHGVTDSHLHQLGASGILLSGGDRKSLVPSEHYAHNNHIHDYGRVQRTYTRAVALWGVGNRATHNLIHDAPHQAIAFGGNDHRIEFNEIHHVCLESNDAGAIYAGRDWTMRGTIIRHNYLHDITGFRGRGCVGVYLDDMFCGTQIVGNVFHRVTRAAFIGGGRDVTIANNIFVDCHPAIHVDARALGWAHGHADAWIREAKEKGTLSGIRYRQPPYRDRYPKLVEILEDEPAAPKGNVIDRNICAGGTWLEITKTARPYLTLGKNLVSDTPGFIDRSANNFQLRDDSPAWKLGFQRIPIEKIGLLPSGNLRAPQPRSGARN